MEEFNIKTILNTPSEQNEEDKVKSMIDEILSSVSTDTIVSTLENVSQSTKEEGINSSYEGNIIAEDGINRLLAGINVNTAVKEQLVMRVEPLKIDNLYDHYLLQARLCGVPIEVFLDTEATSYQDTQQDVQQTSNIPRRVEVGETFEDYSQNFKVDLPFNIKEGDDEPLQFDTPTEQDEPLIFEDTTPTVEQPVTLEEDEPLVFEEEQEEPLTFEEEQEEPITFEEEQQDEPLVFEEETEEEVEFVTEDVQQETSNVGQVHIPFETEQPSTDDEPIVFEEEQVQPTEQLDEEDDITRLMNTIGLDVQHLTPTGAGISKTYSLEKIRPITGGTSEI